MTTSEKDGWDKFKIWSGPVSAIFGTVAVALLGIFGQIIVQNMEAAESERQILAGELRFRSEQDARRDERMSLFVHRLIADAVEFVNYFIEFPGNKQF